jgi:hypothetical protein
MTITNPQDIVWDLLESESKVRFVPPTKDYYEEPLPVTRADNREVFDYYNQYVDGWLSLVSEELYSNPAVEDIFVSIDENDVDIWVVIPQRDITVLHQLAEREWELTKILVSGERSPAFLVDFHVIYRCGRNIEDLAPTRAILLPR